MNERHCVVVIVFLLCGLECLALSPFKTLSIMTANIRLSSQSVESNRYSVMIAEHPKLLTSRGLCH